MGFFKRFYNIALSPKKRRMGREYMDEVFGVRAGRKEHRVCPSFMDILLFHWLFKD